METRYATCEIQNDLLITLPSSLTIGRSVKRTAIYSLVFILTGLLMSLFITSEMAATLSGYLKQTFFLTAFLFLGAGHIFCFRKWLPDIHSEDAKNRLLYSLLLTLLTGLFIFLLFLFIDVAKPQLAITGASAFLLPTAVLESWNYFDSITTKTYPPWYLPAIKPAQTKASIFLNSLQLRIKLKINYYDIDANAFMVAAPGSIQLGNMFHQFLVEEERAPTPIQLGDEQQNPYGWQFLLQRPMGARALDPGTTLVENRVKQNDIILVERIKITMDAPSFNS